MRSRRLTSAPLLLLILGLAVGASSLTFTHLAGSFGGPGFEDGSGTGARFKSAAGIAADSAGNIYVADTGNHTIRKVSAAGEVTTLAGLAESSGTANGRGHFARFNSPRGLVVDGSGVVYVVDSGNHAIRTITSIGVVSSFAGYPGLSGSTNGNGTFAKFRNPRGITRDGAGNLYVADTGNHLIRMITPGGTVSTLAGTGLAGNSNGTGTSASFNAPTGIVYESVSNALYVTDSLNRVVRQITLPGAVVSTFAGTMGEAGHVDGAAGIGRFFKPSGISYDPAGSLFYVSDATDHTIRSITTGGTLGSVAGFATYPGPENGTGGAAKFNAPEDVAVYGTYVHVADTGNHNVRRITTGSNDVITLAGLANAPGNVNDTGSLARFNSPTGLAGYAGPGPSTSYTYVADTGNQSIKRVFESGLVEFVAGGTFGFQDGSGSNARFRNPEGLALAMSDLALFVADKGNHCIRRVTYAGAVTLYAGQATVPGNANGNRLTAASFSSPRAVALNNAGTALYVADTGNYLVRRIDLTSGEVTTLAGSGTFGSTNGNGTSASFGTMTGIYVDNGENVYVAESVTGTIRRIAPNGDVTTFAGALVPGGPLDGTGTSARFGYPGPTSIAGGYVADPKGHLIRSVNYGTAAIGTAGGRANVNGTSDGTGAFARFNGAAGIGLIGSRLAIAEGHTIRLGGPEIADRATIDSAAGRVGSVRQLDTSPQTATSWEWTVIRRPAGSTATLSSNTIRNPTFTPDVPDMFIFRCKATSASGSSISTVTLNGNDAASTFTLGYPGPLEAGVSQMVTVYARDQWGNIADGYTGTVHFTSDDGLATLPSDYTYSSGEHGAHAFSFTFRQSGVRSVTVTDAVTGSITGTGYFTVNPAAASTLSVTIASPAGSGNPTDVTVAAVDPYGNIDTSYEGTITFTSSDGAATLPSNYTFVPGDFGDHVFAGGVTLRTAGIQTVTATDTVTASITNSAYVTVGPPMPTAFAATRSGAQIALSWNASSGADHYDVYRAAPGGGGYLFLASTGGTAFSDTTVSSNSVYAYKVRAVDASGNPSPFSTADAGTTIVFTDDPVVAGSTVVRLVHLSQARTAVNSLRACAGLSPTVFTDDPLTTSTLVKRLHIEQLRTALTAARNALGLPAIAYTDPTLTTSITVKAIHVENIRSGVR